jgi:hypothetical protein
MAVLRHDRFTVDPVGTGEMPARHAAVVVPSAIQRGGGRP